MLRLLLLRHAKSDWEHPGLLDHDRPLAARGLRDAPRVGAFLRERGLVPAAALASTARRTTETARLVLVAAGAPAEALRRTRALYGASREGILRIVRAEPGSASPLLVVAHNPGMGDLAARLRGRAEAFPTAALAVFAFAAARWADIEPDEVAFEAFQLPRDLPDPTDG